MQIEFVGTPQLTSTDGVEAETRVDGDPVVCVVTAEALAAVAPDPFSRGDAIDLFRTHEDLFRDVMLDKLGLAGRQRPDRVLILAADVTNRRY